MRVQLPGMDARQQNHSYASRPPRPTMNSTRIRRNLRPVSGRDRDRSSATVPALAMLALLALFSSGCNHQPDTAKAANGPAAQQAKSPPQVHIAAVEYHAWPELVQAQGSLLADDEAVLGAKVAGRVERVTVDIGAPVKKDDELVVLDRSEFELAVRQAEAQLVQAMQAIGIDAELNDTPPFVEDTKRPEDSPIVRIESALLSEAIANRERGDELARLGSAGGQAAITRHELQRLHAAEKVARSRYDSAVNQVREKLALIKVRRAELAVARQQLAETVIRAPFDGFVMRRHAAAGTYLQVGQQAITLVRTDPLRFRGRVPERKAAQVRLGQEIHVRIAGREQPIVARVSRIAPSLEIASRSLVIEADIPNPGGQLRTGLYAEADIVVNPHAEALAIPASALEEFAGVRKVWLVRDGNSAPQPIQTGRRTHDMIEVISGLQRGDVIIQDSSQGVIGQVQAVPASLASAQEAG